MAEPEVEQRVETKPQTSAHKEDCAHIVMVPPGETDETPQAYVMRARIEGFPITALCGYTWVPNKMATGLPVCDECLAIYEAPGDRTDPDRSLPDE